VRRRQRLHDTLELDQSRECNVTTADPIIHAQEYAVWSLLKQYVGRIIATLQLVSLTRATGFTNIPVGSVAESGEQRVRITPMSDNDYLDPPALPWNDDDRDRGITAREALIRLLENESSLSQETFNFVHSCARFPRLSPKQQQALVETWRTVEVALIAQRAKRARLNRRRRQRNGGGSE
jgi:hypothetical protein